MIDKAIRAYAKDNDLNLPDPFADLLLENINVSVVLNIYQPQDVKRAPIFLADGRQIQGSDWLRGLISQSRDSDEVAQGRLDGYSPSAAPLTPPTWSNYVAITTISRLIVLSGISWIPSPGMCTGFSTTVAGS